jgi:glucuronokinase
LIQATCKVFAQLCHINAIEVRKGGFNLEFSTNIPRMVGLSGSSAIIIATFRALLKYYDLKLSDFNLELEGLRCFNTPIRHYLSNF